MSIWQVMWYPHSRKWFGVILRNYYVHTQVQPFTGDTYQSRPDLNRKIFKYYTIRAVFRKKTLFMDDRMIICDTHIWTEIDLESYV